MPSFIISIFAMLMGAIVTFSYMSRESQFAQLEAMDKGVRMGAIAAHKGEIVCVNIPFKEDRWECGEP